MSRALQEDRCAICGAPIEHVHRITPKSKDGSDGPENLPGLCASCHARIHTGDKDTRNQLTQIGRQKYGALSVLNQAIPYIYEVKQFRRHDRAITNNQCQRSYKLNGKTVGKNRRKGFAQKEPSLKEFSESLPPEDRQKILSQIKVTPSQRRYNRKDRMLPGNVFWFAGSRNVMSGQLSGGAYLCAEGEGTKNLPISKCRIVKNSGLVYL